MNSRNQEARRGLGHKVLPFDREDKKRPCPGMEKNRATEVEASPYHGTIGPSEMVIRLWINLPLSLRLCWSE